MFRNTIIGAFVGMAALLGTPAAWSESVTYGVFRENVPNVPDDQRNCWAQAMVAGQTINGEVIAERLTQKQAESRLQRDAQRGVCANQRQSASWSARKEKEKE